MANRTKSDHDDSEPEDFAKMGLGKAVNITLNHPWIFEESYQAKEAKSEDGICTTSVGNRVEAFEEYAESHFEVLKEIEGWITVPSHTTEISVAADKHRSEIDKKHIKGTAITTRTISFQLGYVSDSRKTMSGSTPHGSVFQRNLHAWIEHEDRKTDEQNESNSKATAEQCREFLLRRLGGATHYISSITLGAMLYRAKTVSETRCLPRTTSFSGSGKASSGIIKSSFRRRQYYEQIGRVPSSVDTHTMHKEDEDVTRYSITPLTDLVSDKELRGHLQQAIQKIVESTSQIKRGPFLIQSSSDITDHSVYWKMETGVKSTPYTIKATANKDEASDFYLSREAEHSGRVFFLSACISGVECYLRLQRNSWFSKSCTIEAVTARDRKKSQLVLMNSNGTNDLQVLGSDWLPDINDKGGNFISGEAHSIRPVYYSIPHFLTRFGFHQTSIAMSQRQTHRRVVEDGEHEVLYVTKLGRTSREHAPRGSLMLHTLEMRLQ